MSSFLNNNKILFAKRFPHLTELLSTSSKIYLPENITILRAKDNSITAKDCNLYLHSSYNPKREAEKIANTDQIKNAKNLVFYGFGLGYLVQKCAKLYPDKTIVLIEPNPNYVEIAFETTDWKNVFTHNSLIFFIKAAPQNIIHVLENIGLNSCAHIYFESYTQHDKAYFSGVKKLAQRNRQKEKINEATRKRFSKRWLKNICKNKCHYEHCGTIKAYENGAQSLEALIIAAGPSLETILSHLKDLKKTYIIICVDTALKACLKAGIEPHFIVLCDPQYWNARHLDRLETKNSILITEIAAYPSVFRFKCKKKILCASQFPLGNFIEQYTGDPGKLCAGGSVSSTAWDFARYIGCKKIYLAGLDLGFPGKKTHTKGSTFEEKNLREAYKLSNAETANASILYSISTDYKKDYNGNSILTDERMSLYAWWFESKCAQYPEVKTHSLTPQSLAIPLVKKALLNDILHQKSRTKDIEDFLLKSENIDTTIPNSIKKSGLERALISLQKNLQKIHTLSKEAVEICTEYYVKNEDYVKALKNLTKIDEAIQKSSVIAITSLIFPTADELEKKAIKREPKKFTTKYQENLFTSKLLYESIIESVETHFSLLFF